MPKEPAQIIEIRQIANGYIIFAASEADVFFAATDSEVIALVKRFLPVLETKPRHGFDPAGSLSEMTGLSKEAIRKTLRQQLGVDPILTPDDEEERE